MRLALVSTLSALSMAACDNGPTALIPDGFCEHRDMKGTPPDMSSKVGTCAAAKGLTGDNLVCVDFSSIPDGPLGPANSLPAALAGWDFVSQCGGMYWEVASGKLDIKMFSNFSSMCGFQVPSTDLNAAANQKYHSYSISVVHSLDINKQKQSAGIYLGLAIDAQQIWASTSTNSRQTTTITIDKTALPNGGGTTYQPLFTLLSNAPSGGYNGWQIESVAVNATP